MEQGHVVVYTLAYVIFQSIILLCEYGYTAGSPDLISRQQWRAHDAVYTRSLHTPVDEVRVYKRDSPDSASFDMANEARELQLEDMYNMGMPDIRYNFMIGPHGEVFVGRGWRVEGQHGISNRNSYGILFIGSSQPTDRAVVAVVELIRQGIRYRHLTPSYTTKIFNSDLASVAQYLQFTTHQNRENAGGNNRNRVNAGGNGYGNSRNSYYDGSSGKPSSAAVGSSSAAGRQRPDRTRNTHTHVGNNKPAQNSGSSRRRFYKQRTPVASSRLSGSRRRVGRKVV